MIIQAIRLHKVMNADFLTVTYVINIHIMLQCLQLLPHRYGGMNIADCILQERYKRVDRTRDFFLVALFAPEI